MIALVSNRRICSQFIAIVPNKRYSRNLNVDYKIYFKTLGVSEDADQEAVRQAFIKLCKQYHPDSSPLGTDSSQFHKIEEAYRMLQKKFSEDRWNVNEGLGEYGLYYNEPKEYDIEHTAPQHRQYLSYDGIGTGTPSQRQLQFEQFRAQQAADRVRQHRFNKYQSSSEHSALVNTKKAVDKIKTRFGMDRLVEDLIQESMAKGDFDNLAGRGKPLSRTNFNPYVDFTTNKINEILIDNGFTPEWITMGKEIDEEFQRIRGYMRKKRRSFQNYKKWRDEMGDSLNNDVLNLNKMISSYNLVVPILRLQMFFFNIEKEAESVWNSENFVCDINDNEKDRENVNEQKSVIDFFVNILHRKH